MKNRNAEAGKKKKRVVSKEYFDMYDTKEQPIFAARRALGPMYEPNKFHLRVRVVDLTTDTKNKAVKMLTGLYNAGFVFTFNHFGGFRIAVRAN